MIRFKATVQRHASVRHERAYAAAAGRRAAAIRASVASQLAERQRLLGSIKGEISRSRRRRRRGGCRRHGPQQARIAAAQAAQAQALSATVVGASASTPEGATVVPASAYGSKVVSIAMSYLGVPYVWGGASPGGFDCSGLVMYAYAQIGIGLPHSSYAQANNGTYVPTTSCSRATSSSSTRRARRDVHRRRRVRQRAVHGRGRPRREPRLAAGPPRITTEHAGLT